MSARSIRIVLAVVGIAAAGAGAKEAGKDPPKETAKPQAGRIGAEFLPMAQASKLTKPALKTIERALQDQGAKPEEVKAVMDALEGAVASGETKGLLLLGVLEEGPAQKAGLKVGDVVVAVGGKRYDGDAEKLAKALRGRAAGRPFPIGFIRKGREREVEVVAVDRATEQRLIAKAKADSLPAKPLQLGFDEDAIDTLPSGWKAGKTGKGTVARWAVTEDKEARSGSRVLAVQEATNGARTANVCLFGGASYQGAILTIHLKALDGEVDQGGGMILCAQDNRNYYLCRLSTKKGQIRFYKVEQGKATELAGADVSAEPRRWHEISIHKLWSDRIMVSLNRKPILDVRDSTFKNGMAGVWTLGDASTAFDDIEVKPQARPQPKGT